MPKLRESKPDWASYGFLLQGFRSQWRKFLRTRLRLAPNRRLVHQSLGDGVIYPLIQTWSAPSSTLAFDPWLSETNMDVPLLGKQSPISTWSIRQVTCSSSSFAVRDT